MPWAVPPYPPDCICKKVASVDEYRLAREEMHRLNMAVFDVADPTKALQLGAFISMIGPLLLRPTQSCKLNRNSLKVSTEFQESASFGQTDTVNVVSRGQNKSGSTVDEHLFIMHQFDQAAFNPIWWLSALDVHLNDVKLPQQPYTAKDGPFSGQQAYSFVEMAAKGMTDSKPEHHTSVASASQPGLQQPVFSRIPVLPKANDITQPCVANELAQFLLLPALQRIGCKGPDADKLADKLLCRLLRNGICCILKSNGVSDEMISRLSKHQQGGLSLASVRYGARTALELICMLLVGYHSVKDAQGSRGWRSTHVPTYEVLDSEVGSCLRQV